MLAQNFQICKSFIANWHADPCLCTSDFISSKHVHDCQNTAVYSGNCGVNCVNATYQWKSCDRNLTKYLMLALVLSTLSSSFTSSSSSLSSSTCCQPSVPAPVCLSAEVKCCTSFTQCISMLMTLLVR